jgi:hypothetical protein
MAKNKTAKATTIITLAQLKTVASNVVAQLNKQGHTATLKVAKSRMGVNVKGHGLVAGFGPIGKGGSIQVSCQFGQPQKEGQPYPGYSATTKPDWAAYSRVKGRYNVLSGKATPAQLEATAKAALKGLPR